MPIRFVYQKDRKGSLIECKDERIGGQRVLTLRDMDEATAEQTNYLRYIGNGDRSYTQEAFDQSKDYNLAEISFHLIGIKVHLFTKV